MQRKEITAEKSTVNQGSREIYNLAIAIFGIFLLYTGEKEVFLDLSHRGNNAKSKNYLIKQLI